MKTLFLGSLMMGVLIAGSGFAYDGTHCKAAGICWEPKPGYPAKVAGSKYDPRLDPKEIAKQDRSERDMEARNAKRVAHFRKTGIFVYDVNKITD